MTNKTFTIKGQFEVTDGYHTFDELYEHRHALFMALLSKTAGAWKSKKHANGSSFDGWFIAGVKLSSGDITYHLPMRLWEICPGGELETAPTWDGHTSQMVIDRLMTLFF